MPAIFGNPPPGLDTGCGYGYGYGYGYGSGYGDGDGDGCGYGYGDGYGYGYGYGSGYGDGDGDGCGYGCGYGYGDGSGEYWKAYLAALAGERGAALVEQGCVLAFWRSNAKGQPCNGGSGVPVAPGTVEEVEGPLALCTANALHATLEPAAWEGKRLWVVALYPPVAVSGNKMGSLKREVICEITPNPFA